MKDITYKLIALFLACLVWLYVANQELEEVVRKVPLRIELANSSMTIVGGTPNELTVTFAVPAGMVRTMSTADIEAYRKIDPEPGVDQYTFRIGPMDIKRPLGRYRVEQIDPQELTLQIDQLSTVKLPVRAELYGEPGTGYRVMAEDVRIDPEEVLVSGPLKKLNSLQEVFTEPIDVVGRTRSFRKKVELASYTDIRPANDTALEVFVPITERFDSKMFPDLPIQVLGSPFEMILAEVEPARITVEISGPARLLDELKPEELLIYVDVSGLKRGEFELPFGYRLPRELSFKTPLPKARVKIGEVKIK